MVTGDSQEEVLIFRYRQTDSSYYIYIIIATGGAKPAPAECDEGARREKCAHSQQVLYMMMTMMMEMVVVVLVMLVMVLTPSRC